MANGSDRTVVVQMVINGAQAVVAGFNHATSASQQFAHTIAQNAEAADKLARPLGVIGTVAAAGVVAAVKAFADFDERMSSVKSLSHATADQMADLTDAALHSGTAIGYSAKQAADAQIELVKAGVSATDIIGGGLTGALQLAAAGQIDVAQATEIAASTMSQFQLKGGEVVHVADLLAAGADKALGSVADLGEGLKYIGPVAKANNISLEQTVGTLSLLAQNGIMGEQAGTGLRGMLLSLTAPSELAAKKMAELGLNVYDSSGQFVGFNGVAEQLKEKLGGVDQATRNAALGTIFGNAQVTTATVLMKDGAKAVNQWTKDVDESGFAATQAAGKMDNLNGDLKKLGASLQNSLIESGSAANTSLRGLTQGATGLVTAFNNAPSFVQGTALALLGLTAALSLGGAGFLTIVPKIAATRAALSTMQVTAGGVAKTIGKGSAVLIAVAALTNAFSSLGSESELTTEQMSKINKGLDTGNIRSLNEQFSAGVRIFGTYNHETKGIGDALDSITKGSLRTNFELTKFADGLTFGLTHVSDTGKRFEAQFKQLGQTLGAVAKEDFGTAADQFSQLAAQTDGSKDAVTRLLDSMPDYKAALIDLAGQQGITLTDTQLLALAQGEGAAASKIAAGSAAELTNATDELQGAAADASGSVKDLAEQISGFGKAQFDTDAATRSLEQSVDDFTETIKKAHPALTDGADGFKLTEQSGRDAQAAIEDIAKSTLDLASATYTQTGSQQQASAVLADGRQKFLDAAKAAGISGKAAEDYANRLGLIPKNVGTAISNNAAAAKTPVDQLRNAISGIPANVNSNVVVNTGNSTANLNATKNAVEALSAAISTAASRAAATPIVAHATGPMQSFAVGGPIFGAGTGTSDSVVIRASNGEHMLTAAEVSAAGGHGAILAMRRAILSGGMKLQGYATGGPIGARPDLRYAGQNPTIIVQSGKQAGRTAPYIGQVTLTREDNSARSAVDELMFQLRTLDDGGH